MMILATLAVLAATLGDYTIVRPKEISAADETVLRDFGSLLAKSLGTELKTATEGDAPSASRIFFGIAPSGTDVSALGAQDLVTSVDAKGDVYLYGGGTTSRFSMPTKRSVPSFCFL